jgi:hypothetical protein
MAPTVTLKTDALRGIGVASATYKKVAYDSFDVTLEVAPGFDVGGVVSAFTAQFDADPQYEDYGMYAHAVGEEEWDGYSPYPQRPGNPTVEIAG